MADVKTTTAAPSLDNAEHRNGFGRIDDGSNRMLAQQRSFASARV
jgi:hypothetical protein